MTRTEAIKLAIEVLKAEADKHLMDERAIRLLGDDHHATREARRGAERRATLLQAVEVLRAEPREAAGVTTN